MEYEAIEMYSILFLLDSACTFNTKILAPLECLKTGYFTEFLKFEINSCQLSKKILNALLCFPDQLEMGL